METLKLSALMRSLTPRARNAHKGNFGHVLVIGGDVGYAGAVRMAAEAALRVGAGLVSVATHPAHAAFINMGRPEIMSHPILLPDELNPLLEKATVLVVGPGLGRSAWGRMLWEKVLTSEKEKIVDADALYFLAQKYMRNTQWVLTPHAGEAARLLHQSVEDVEQDRENAAINLQNKYGGVIVLKGCGTLVAGEKIAISHCKAGNPGMASGGMGDVLSGVIGGLAAQHVPLVNAAKLGVVLHASAGDLAAKEGERGLLASDLYPYLRRLVNTRSR